MQYKIGDVAHILGISTDLLRYYEKKGVVTPSKDKQNDYRYYDAWDINFLIDCLWYKNFGFGIPQIAYMVSDCYYGDLISVLEEKQTELMDSIHHQELLLRRIRQHCEQVIRVRDLVGKCDLSPSPEVVCFFNRYDTFYDNSPEMQKLAKQWLQYMPFLQRYFEIPLYPERVGGHQYSWGFSLAMEYVEEFSVLVKPPLIHHPEVECIHSVFKSSGKNAFSPKHIDYLFDYAAENGYTPSGNARGNLVCSVLDEGALTGFFEVWLPVTKD
ncbi:MAG: MerR family transcriptional regulator [Lachnospiraceae bacterium]|nr:MerR family transcriptional regulator [Lachnospiraceae bacterium]MDO4529843.1 MerR family transcriptional regulator [Lachnospiraceae bacterium]MDO4734049.1 MerR family transcriptional regulator [Lachnospiraceae bacterium]